MRKDPTTKEWESSAAERRAITARGQARTVLETLGSTKRLMSEINSKETRKVAQELEDRISWLVAESEIYRDVAAELWLRGQSPSEGCVSNSPTNLDRD